MNRDPAPSRADADRRFHIATEEEIKKGRTTDVYFPRAMNVLEQEDLAGEEVFAELTAGRIPGSTDDDPLRGKGMIAGLDEAIALLEHHPVDVWALPEGTLFPHHDDHGIRFPVMQVAGAYRTFGALETPLLGLLCHATGIATKTARIRMLAGDADILSFGIRRMHPAIAPMVDRAAYLAGADGVSGVLGAEQIGIRARGTMPHAMILIFGDSRRAFAAWHAHSEKELPRVALVDTYSDETREVEAALDAMGDELDAVRLDTPGSRRGDLPRIVQEVRWRLDQKGREDVKIFVSGGIDEHDIPRLVEVGVTGFGVGTSIAAAPPVDFALDIVATKTHGDWAKRGKFPGPKDAMRCEEPGCDAHRVLTRSQWASPASERECPRCGSTMRNLLVPVIQGGKIVHKENLEETRARAARERQRQS